MKKQVMKLYQKAGYILNIRLKPSFIIIGGMKCGTTSLYEYVTEHPKVKRASKKEVRFFDRNLNYNKGLSWYLSHFPVYQPNYVTGESSPSCLFVPFAPQRIAELIPSVKIIIILRNPIDRAYSHYYHNVRKKREELTFEEAIDKEDLRLANELDKIRNNPQYDSYNYIYYSYLSRGLYADQINNWFNYFPREQFLIIDNDDLLLNPIDTMTKVFSFLDLSYWEVNTSIKHNSHVGDMFQPYPKMNGDTRQYLIDYFESHNQKLYKLLNRNLNWDT